MSLYNMAKGVQPATFFVLPMLGKHPDEYPRFRDCFIGRAYEGKDLDVFGVPNIHHGKEDCITIYTRVGGNNRDGHKNEIEKMRKMPEYLEDFDDNFDSTYAFFIFQVPQNFIDDFRKIRKGNIVNTSPRYKKMLYKVYPKLKKELDIVFKNEDTKTWQSKVRKKLKVLQ